MVSSRLSAFQREALAAIFARSGETLFLTGGAALAGFHLGHRTTDDLDLFTVDVEAFQRTRYVIGDAAEALGASLEVRQDGPGFRRYALVRGDDALVVDTFLERVAQLHPVKLRLGDVLLDSPDEILANNDRPSQTRGLSLAVGERMGSRPRLLSQSERHWG